MSIYIEESTDTGASRTFVSTCSTRAEIRHAAIDRIYSSSVAGNQLAECEGNECSPFIYDVHSTEECGRVGYALLVLENSIEVYKVECLTGWFGRQYTIHNLAFTVVKYTDEELAAVIASEADSESSEEEAVPELPPRKETEAAAAPPVESLSVSTIDRVATRIFCEKYQDAFENLQLRINELEHQQRYGWEEMSGDPWPVDQPFTNDHQSYGAPDDRYIPLDESRNSHPDAFFIETTVTTLEHPQKYENIITDIENFNRSTLRSVKKLYEL
jgi:hypothetical protein